MAEVSATSMFCNDVNEPQEPTHVSNRLPDDAGVDGKGPLGVAAPEMLGCPSFSGRSKKVRVAHTGDDMRGRSWFARELIREGEFVYWPYEGHEALDYRLADILSWSPNRRRAFFKLSYQVDDEIYNGYHSDTELPIDAPEDYKLDWCLNHSCDPNVWYLEKDVITARRDIQEGEELTYDYATTQANAKMDMSCACGATSCRGRIRGDDWKLSELQRRYGDHFLPYIRRKISAWKQEQERPTSD